VRSVLRVGPRHDMLRIEDANWGLTPEANAPNEPNWDRPETARTAKSTSRRHCKRGKSCETNPIGPGRTWGARTGRQVRKGRHAAL
jgi:hypothetical protein